MVSGCAIRLNKNIFRERTVSAGHLIDIKSSGALSNGMTSSVLSEAAFHLFPSNSSLGACMCVYRVNPKFVRTYHIW